MLWWAVTHPDDIVKQNFLMGADGPSFKNLADYDALEVRHGPFCQKL
jgi:hypothetical protein